MSGTLRKAWLWMLACGLLLLAAPAFALGLGQIQVKSQRNQPLLAEIPIISSDPSELENLQARLASPETFARVGLEPPQGIVSDLQFTVALDARGNPVIRVTSQAPVQQPLLTFLLEVDWGQGRLVREYSALLDAPNTVSAPTQPQIAAPTVAPSNTIAREPAPVPAPVAPPPSPADMPVSPAPVAAANPEPSSAQGNGVDFAPGYIPNASTPAVPSQAAPTQAAPSPTGEYRVKAGDTLSGIAGNFGGQGYSLDQTMLALLRANPDAFIKGNVNLVKRGAVLRVPQPGELTQYNAAEASAIVREQVSQWRELRAAAQQPVAVAGQASTMPAAKIATDRTNKARTSEARLEIVPPSANGGKRAGTQSGIQAGGEGEMLQELQQTRETLAARDAEVQELKTRVADLEKLQHEQQQLIALKDGKLADAQRNLAQQQAATTTAKPADAAQKPQPHSQPMLWPWLVAALVLVLAIAWLFSRRRKPSPRPVFNTAVLAAGVPVASRESEIAVPSPASPAPADDAPLSHSPTWHSGVDHASMEPGADAITPLNSAPAGHERLELARAYLDLGDADTARSLLQEVANGGNEVARDEALRLLRELN